ncbi:MAG: Galactose/methyl galactoside import ATP-binding protein MglA [Lentisphaerae bacterium ADurb.Bin242]|nr:MAG: Galactose/methyl galactoside import ATP-binding protein MglA [Lentisphaerae bacterium ADurb.Bin242]
MTPDPLLRISALTKSYAGVVVLKNVSFSVPRASIVGLIGENGAGKSTLIQCVNGVTRPDSGSILFDGREITPVTIASALKHGIVTIPQEFNLADPMTVSENVFLGHELKKHGFLDCSAMRRRTRELLEELHCNISADAEVSALRIAEKQIVEIARAINRECRLLIMDEPSTVLNPPEVENLFRIMRAMRERGVSLLYVSHKLSEVKEICDTVAVLRDGEFISENPASELTVKEMANRLVGRELNRIFPPKTGREGSGVPALSLENLSHGKRVRGVSLELHKGEILGLAGLGGAGRTELAETVYGIRARTGGSVKIDGMEKDIRSPAEAVAAGIAYLTEDRQKSGIIQSFPLARNLSLISLKKYCSGPFIRHKKEEQSARGYMERFRIKTPSAMAPVRELSGGNQQKGAIAKSLDADPGIFLFDEPTRGIDIHSRGEIYRFIHSLAEAGMACLVISSDLEELIGLCPRVAVMREGALAGVLEGEHINEKEIMYLAAGVQ